MVSACPAGIIQHEHMMHTVAVESPLRSTSDLWRTCLLCRHSDCKFGSWLWRSALDTLTALSVCTVRAASRAAAAARSSAALKSNSASSSQLAVICFCSSSISGSRAFAQREVSQSMLRWRYLW